MTSRESEGIWKTNIDPDLSDAELFLRIFRPRIDAGGPPAAVLALKMRPPEPAGRGGGSFLRGFLNNRRRA